MLHTSNIVVCSYVFFMYTFFLVELILIKKLKKKTFEQTLFILCVCICV